MGQLNFGLRSFPGSRTEASGFRGRLEDGGGDAASDDDVEGFPVSVSVGGVMP